MTSVVEVTRGPIVESRHVVHVAVVHADRGLVAWSGDAGCVTYVRSAIKMFQALPLVEDDVVARLGMTADELAVCAASHNGEDVHVASVQRILRRVGVDESALACGPHAPFHEPAAAALAARHELPRRIHNNCSGKHAGMLALARRHGWAVADYHHLTHPVQQRACATLSAWTGVAEHRMVTAIDGCGVPTFALPVDRVALACARFAGAAADGGAAREVAGAMMAHPHMVAGTSHLVTDLMTAAGGRIFAKNGAEGYYCAGIPERRLGLALKVEDGARRAAEPALLAVLHAIGALSDADLSSLVDHARPVVHNTRGEVVGDIRARITLTRA